MDDIIFEDIFDVKDIEFDVKHIELHRKQIKLMLSTPNAIYMTSKMD